MSRNTLLVAAVVVALVLGGVLWFTLSPEREQEVAGARPAGQSEQELSKKPTSDTQNQGTQPGQGGVTDTDGSAGQRTAEVEGETETAAAAEQQAAAEPTDTAAASAEPPAAAAPPAASMAPPSFDIVRVEKDGNAVIAGRAEPGAAVQLFDGDAVIAEGQAGGDGSFALVLDEPLPEGTRRLSLAIVSPDGTLVPSEDEVVVVVKGTGATAEAAPSAAATAAQQSAEAAVAAVELATAEPAAGATGTTTGETTTGETTSSETTGETATQAAESAEAVTTGESTATAEATPAPAPSPATEPAAEAQASQPETTASGSDPVTTTTEPAASASETATATTESQTAETLVADTPKLAEQLAAEQGVASASTSAETKSEVAAAGSSEPLVVIQPKSGQGASQVLQGAAPASGKPTVSIEAVDYDLKGQVVISGSGPAGAQVLLYLDHAVLGQSTVDGDGRWQFTPEQNVAAGLHRLRADLVGADGGVTARAEIPFQRAEPIQVAADEEFIVVQPGHSLWVIARKRYGEGLQYSAIYEANATQIRNPDLIYPGQIFLVPTVN